MIESIIGQCHCGNIEWEAVLPPKIILNCHCNMCRQLSGADYSSWVVLLAESFQITKGSNSLSHYQATEKFIKAFCSHCGSTVSCVNNAKFPQHIYVARGSIVSRFEMPVNLQVYTHDKADWLTIDETIPIFNP